jgi:transcriptional regulator with XRE-family HTH domain
MIREWRTRRRLSQLDLSVRTGVSTRHLSCVETGKSVASRQLIWFLAQELDIPLRERNVLLVAAGYAPEFGQTPLDDAHLAPALDALDRLLASHEPYPAVIIDWHWNVVRRNASSIALTADIAVELKQPPINVLRSALHPHGLASRILNLQEWSGHLLRRLRRQIDLSADPVLVELEREVLRYPGIGERTPPPSSHDLFVPLRLRYRGTEVTLLNTLTVFAAPLDAGLADLVLESFHPIDEHSARVFREAAAERAPSDGGPGGREQSTVAS